ncbi:tyrosine-protein phosphatase [Pseudoalteromonas ardens]|uniref:Protein phosphatase n=1 Tax=Pseudoalteromonas rubra TaxID=43658 RepID=A0A0L0ENB9_9GAMM|nr:tyrosine-protein phosphatase [Pseudoalteromonas sp. R96]KNC65982.1 protein phosphatase [Pseudoalteromonas rubra]MDK1310170.1 tyrosine-protein phosphatase [Pseudoalteromonas sp. R96]
MTSHPFDTLRLGNGAALLFTPCPGTKGTTLDESVRQLRDAGAQAIVTLMYPSELESNEATALPQVCEDLGMSWFQLPIADDAPPNEDFTQAFVKSWPQLKAILSEQGTVAVHCKGGSGRTGLAIGLIMYQLGLDKADIIPQVQSLRPKALNHPAQLGFFNQFSRFE